MVKARIRRIGNSLGIILPKEVLNGLNVNEGEDIYISEGEGFSYRMSPLNKIFADQIKEANHIMKEDSSLLSELAKK